MRPTLRPTPSAWVALLTAASVWTLFACFHACEAGGMPRPQYDWETNYGYWRHHETVTLEEWTARTPAPVPQLLSIDALNGMGEKAKTELFHECLVRQAKGLSANVLRYRSPRLEDVTAAVRGTPCLPTHSQPQSCALSQTSAHVACGSHRYSTCICVWRVSVGACGPSIAGAAGVGSAGRQGVRGSLLGQRTLRGHPVAVPGAESSGKWGHRR